MQELKEAKRPRTVHGVAAIIEQDHKVFAAERGYGKWSGWWEFPGGKIESGESPKQAVIREIREELDASIEVIRPFITLDFEYEEFRLIMPCYLAKFTSEYKLLEHSDAMFVDSSNIYDLKWLPSDIAAIDKLVKEHII